MELATHLWCQSQRPSYDIMLVGLGDAGMNFHHKGICGWGFIGACDSYGQVQVAPAGDFETVCFVT